MGSLGYELVRASIVELKMLVRGRRNRIIFTPHYTSIYPPLYESCTSGFRLCTAGCWRQDVLLTYLR